MRVDCNSREEGDELLVVHAAIDGTFGNLEAVDVDNGDNGTGFFGVNVLVSVPCTVIKGYCYSFEDQTEKALTWQ